MLDELGYVEDNKGKTSGSRVIFKEEDIDPHKASRQVPYTRNRASQREGNHTNIWI